MNAKNNNKGTTIMDTKAEQNRLDAIMAMPEMSTKVLWGRVVERGIGLNWLVHGTHREFQGPLNTIAALMPQGTLF